MNDPREEYQHTCPKCNECNANQTASHSEEEWVTNYWSCNECDYEWRENFEFTHWDQEE